MTGNGKRVRVLIVDDSLFMRSTIAKTLASGPFEVIGQARDGNDAIAQALKLAPDVITMDFNMPGMNGADTVRTLMQKRPTPVVMFSAHTKQGAKETFDALAAGAVDFVTKPDGEVSTDLSAIADELTRKLIAAASARPRAAAPVVPPARNSGQFRAHQSQPGILPRVCVIGVSTGGPAALSEVIPALPADLRLAVVVVQHMPAGFTGPFAERLDAASKVSVREAEAGERPQAGEVLIAPGNRHLEFDDKGLITLNEGPLVNGCRPAADVTMKSAAKVFGRRCLAVVMTGMGKDGAAGALAIKHVDGKTCAQDQPTSVIYGMPKAAVELGAIDEVVPLAEIATWLRYA
jgi:two-component system chemotaxis response regulator CheB